VNDRVAKFDAAVLNYLKKSHPSESQLVHVVQDEWQKKTKSHLPLSTAKKIAKRLLHVYQSSKVGGKRKTSKRDSQRGGMAHLTDAYALPGSPHGTTLLKLPDDNSTSAFFAAGSPVSYYQIAQDRGAGTDAFAGLKPSPMMGSNAVARSRGRTRKQRGGAAFSIPSSVPANIQTLSVNNALGLSSPVSATGNPVVPGFSLMYSPMKTQIDDSAMRVTSALPLVWKTTA
jgi:hypothetical protein